MCPGWEDVTEDELQERKKEMAKIMGQDENSQFLGEIQNQGMVSSEVQASFYKDKHLELENVNTLHVVSLNEGECFKLVSFLGQELRKGLDR